MDMNQPPRQCFNIAGATGMDCKQTDARDRLMKTQQQEQKIKAAGYTLVVAWECNKPQRKNNNTRATNCDLSTCYCV